MSTGTKPGVRTTEFWLTVAVAVLSFIGAIANVLPDRYAAIASAIVAGLYAIGRGLAKQGTG